MQVKTNRVSDRNWLNFIIIKLVSALCVVYFAAIPFGWVQNKFDIPDIVILFLIFLFNSEILEKLVRLAINRDGITLDLNQIVTEQDNQKASIAAHTANIEAITNILQRLTSLEQEMAASQKEKEHIINSLLSDTELNLLEKLALGEVFNYQKHHEFDQELRHLRAFGFIENLPGMTISGMPETGDLKDYVRITQNGREYLQKKALLEAVNTHAN